jgi:hopanoid biosynthesis associated RND transporter like protein HpnN
MIQRPPFYTASINAYKQLMVWLVDFSRRKAGWVLMSAFLLSAMCLSYTATHLYLDTDTAKMLDPNLPYRQLDLEIERAFPQLHELIVVVVESDTAERAEEVADEMATRLHETPTLYQSIYQPGKGPFFAQNGLLYLEIDDLWKIDERLTEAEPFLGTLSRDPSLRGLFSVMKQAFDEPLSLANQELLAKIFEGISDIIDDQLEGKVSRPFWRKQLLDDAIEPQDIYRSFVLVKPRLDFTSLQVGAGGLANIRHLASQLQTEGPHGVRIRLTGPVALSDDELGSIPQGAGLATLLSFSLVFFILFTGLRSGRLVGAILVTIILGLAWTAAFATLAIGHVNVISICFPVLFIGLGVDFGIQFGMRYREELEKGKSHTPALQDAAIGIGPSLTLAAVTAAISFFSFVPTGYQGLAELGLISGGGMFIALFANLTLLPALLSLFPLKLPLKQEKNGTLWWLGSWMVGHKRITLSITFFTLLAAGSLLPWVQFDFNPLHMTDPKLESVATFLDLLNDPKTTPYTISVLTGNLKEAETLADRLNQLDKVDKTVTLASFVPSEQEEKLAIIEEMNLVLQPITMPGDQIRPPTLEEQVQSLEAFQHQITQPGTREMGEPFLRSMQRLDQTLTRLKTASGWPDLTLQKLQARLLTDLPKNLKRLRDLLSATPVNLEDLPEDIRDQYLTSDGRARVEVFPKHDLSDNIALRQFVQAVQTIAPQATDTPVALLAGGKVVVAACIQATIITLIGAIVILLAALSRIRDALFVLLPLIMATVLTVSCTVLINVPLNLANIIAIPLLFGLGIAFGIYLMLRKRSGLDFDTLFHSSTPRAVLFSALTTMASFGTLAFIDHPGTASIGLLLTIALSAALVCTLVVLPAIVAELEAREGSR